MLTAKTTLLDRRDSRRDDGGMRVMTRMLLICTLCSPALSNAQTAVDGAQSTRPEETGIDPGTVMLPPTPELENRPRSAFENSLMGELACTCGTCKLEPINTCRCDFAARMRGEMLAQFDGLDVSKEAARRAAAEAVRASFVARYGPRVLDRTNRLDPTGRIAGFVLTALVLSLFGIILLGRRSIRRRAREHEASADSLRGN
jgi:hypothetical protein